MAKVVYFRLFLRLTMFKKKTSALLFFQFVLIFQIATAQESIMTEYSPLYVQKLIAVAKENYPKSKAYDHQVRIAKNNLSGEKAAWLDPFSFSYLLRSGDRTLDIVNPQLLTGYQFGVSVSPGTLLRRPFIIKAAKEQVTIAQLEQNEYALQLEAEVTRRYMYYLQSLNTLRLQNKIVVDAEASFNDQKLKYQRSEITLQEYNTASTSLSSAQMSRVQAEANMITAKSSLEELLVRKLEEIK